MYAGYHLIIGAYGFWLPNDPRGSGSTYVASDALFRFGKATKTNSRRSVAQRPHNHARRLAAKLALQRPAVEFTGAQALAIARGLAAYCERSGVTIYACAILPSHLHLVTGLAAIGPDSLCNQLKGAASRQLVAEGLHPFGKERDANGRLPKCFGRGQWKVFLTPARMAGTIRYVEQNPLKEHKRVQHWSFVKQYDC